MAQKIKLRKYWYNLHGLTHTFETFEDLGHWFKKLADDRRTAAMGKRTIKEARYQEGFAAGLGIASDIMLALRVTPNDMGELTVDERIAIEQLRSCEAVIVRKGTTVGELLKGIKA